MNRRAFLAGLVSVFGSRQILAQNKNLFKRPLRIALSSGGAPLSFSSNSQVAGIFPALLNTLLVGHMGLQIQMHLLPWNRAQRSVMSGDNDAFLTYPSKERQKYAIFSNTPLYIEDMGYLFYSPNNQRAADIAQVRNIDDVSNFTMAAAMGTDWESENIPESVRRIVTTNFDSAYRTVQAGRVDFLIQSPETVTYYEARIGAHVPLAKVKADFLQNRLVRYHFGIRRELANAPQLIAEFDHFQSAFKSSTEYQALLVSDWRSQGQSRN